LFEDTKAVVTLAQSVAPLKGENQMNTQIRTKAIMLIVAVMVITIASTRLKADTGTCGGASITLPFTDVLGSDIFFCSIAEAYVSGLTNGTTATTFDPSTAVTREQMAAFTTRTMDQSLKRGSRRAALDQYWTPSSYNGIRSTGIGVHPLLVKSDGADLWVADFGAGLVGRVRASDGKLLGLWGAGFASGVLVAKGLIFVTGTSGRLYEIDPTQPPAQATTLTTALGSGASGIAFDGERVWTANTYAPSVSIVTLSPISVINVTAGFTSPVGILYDGANMWVADQGDTVNPGKLFKLNSSGAIIQTVTVGISPQYPVFDGTNIWVPNKDSDTVTVVRASTGAVLATLGGLSGPVGAAFDGERILITDQYNYYVLLFKASDLSPIGMVNVGAHTFGACSDGLNFWITLNESGSLARF
jgi:YVTN family beta-propeller protein